MPPKLKPIQRAREVIRRHGLLMRFFMRQGYDRDKAHDKSLGQMGMSWREFARNERLAAG